MTNTNTDEPLALFDEWYGEAQDSETHEPTAVTLATADSRGRPSARMVLLKQFDSNGFVFYTNLESHKGRDLRENPFAALLFHWKSLQRQVRIEGAVLPVSDGEADAYFNSRHRSSRIGAWASRQSQPMTGRRDLELEVARYTAKFGIGAIPRPPYWSGFRVIPESFEFWREGKFRLHERIVYTRIDNGWATERLFP
ncbi:MAG: pyridoxamine 5'-phosphate oxidase [Proteobacteria bacterium]|jgi:pyridoxamine 5'-phosphate oxidase|nr:pyridoxamine 5'-phosphate oxidase [Pseudomonadota bacterium]